MDVWFKAEDFIAADVVRWTEGIFDRRRKGKALRIGERQIVAEVLERTDNGWVRLLVFSAVVTKAEFAGKIILPLLTKEVICRGGKTILRGKPERLPWSDESARRRVLHVPDPSKFLPR